MSYTRDRDSVTRGVGAIASRDHAHPNAARAREASRARVTARRDQILAGMTYGARGGLSGLGAISQDNMKGAGGPLHEVVEIGGKSGRIGQSKIPGYNPPPPKNPIPPSSNTATLYMAAFTPPAPSGRGKGTTLEDRRKAGYTPPPVVVAPIAPPKLKEPPRSLPPTIVSGGGSSVSLPPRVVVPDLEPVEIPEIPEIAVDPGPSAAPPSSKRNLLILAGGLGLAAYLLLRDDKKD